MTGLQKCIATLGFLAIAVTTIMAPYRLELCLDVVGCTTHRVEGSLWDPPKEERNVLGVTGMTRRAVELQSGELGIWWAGIVIVTAFLIMLAAPRRSANRGDSDE